MSTKKDDTRKRTTTTSTKEKNLVSKPSTRKSTTKNDEVQKKLSEEEKPLKKSSVIRKETKERNSSINRKDKPTPNATVPSKSVSHSRTPSSSKPPLKSTTKTSSTSSSSRIKTTQYFPSKNLYSNALKSVDTQPKIPKETSLDKKHAAKKQKTEKSTSSLSKTSVKNSAYSRKTSDKLPDTNQLRRTPRDSSPETSSASERPRTATLRKGSIVNENIVGPEAPAPLKTAPAIKQSVLQTDEKSPAHSSAEDNYDDDFESYESDFEAATSSSSEDTNLAITPSGGGTSSVSSDTEELSEKPLISPIKEPKSTSSATIESEKKLDSGTFELSDFKHRQIIKYIEDTMKKEDAIQEQDYSKEKCSHQSLSDEGFEDQRSMQFINFADAKKKCEKMEASAARKKRGEQLLGMIKLDAVSFTIFDSPSVPYDVFIANYGKGNSVQTSTQTGDDDVSEEVQTENIDNSSKWTQMPNKFSTFDINQNNFWANYKAEYKGAGDEADTNSNVDANDSQLDKFLRRSGELILQILFEEKLNNIENLTKNKNELPFSSGYLQFNTTEEVLIRNTTVLNISVHSKNVSKVLTVHLKNNDDDDNNTVKSVVCIWDLDDLNAPRTALVSFGEVSCSAFSLEDDRHVYAGQKDGAVLFWGIDAKNEQYDIISRTPSFVTPIGSSHLSKVVTVQSVPQDHGDVLEQADSSEICTLDETGIIIIWTLYNEADQSNSINNKTLIRTHVIRLPDMYPQFSDLLCTDCIVMENHIYVSTNYGFILHYFIRRSGQTGIKMFVPETKIDSTCLEPCPFFPSYFLAGFSNGDISLYSRTTERPLLVMQNKEQIDSAAIQIIQWSKTRPFLFYAKDSKNVVHIWDLCKSDMYPEYSIPFSGKISAMKLSPVLNRTKEESAYMLIGTEDGKIYLHLLQKEYGQGNFEDFQKDVRIFSNYVNRL